MNWCTAGWTTDLLLFVQHDVRFEAGNAGELFIAHRAGEVGGCVGGLVESEVELHVERLRALVTSVRLQVREMSQRIFLYSILTILFCSFCAIQQGNLSKRKKLLIYRGLAERPKSD